MALTRKFLSALGIDEEKIDEIITAHSETVTALKEERDGFKAKADQYDDIKTKYDTAQKELEDLKAGDDPYKAKYEELKTEYDDYKQKIADKETHDTKVNAYRKLLSEAGISDKRLDSIVKVSDIDSIEMENGAIKDAETVKENIKNEWADFIVTETTKGANTSTPPANTGGTTMTKEDIRKISDPIARQKAMAENKALFGLE